jgi:putative transposase
MPNKYNPEIHHRRSIRLKDYDYSQAGAYFVTLCIKGKGCLLGEIVNRAMVLNDAGKMIEKWWCKLSEKFEFIELDKYVIMPNHFHGIVNIVGADPGVCPVIKNKNINQGEHTGSPLHRIVQLFKTMTTNEYIHGVKQYNWPPFSGKLWQRNYYEHIIHNEDELNKIREYIVLNPATWHEDDENPYKK